MVMTVSAVGAVSLATSMRAGAKTATVITADNYPKYPYRDQRFAIVGALKTSAGNPLADKWMRVYWFSYNDPKFHLLQWTKTDKNGDYRIEDHCTASAIYRYAMVYSGDSVHSPVSKELRIFVGVTKTTLYVSKQGPISPHTLSGKVVDPYGRGIPGLTVNVFKRHLGNDIYGNTQAPWKRIGTRKTDQKGVYLQTDFDNSYVQYYVAFPGNARYWQSNSPTISGYA